ncbi:MAG: hypothetical protein RI911_873 [Candidatus Parcubacteria bacterium]|jgi:dolichol-phosphate mannosyltransferase
MVEIFPMGSKKTISIVVPAYNEDKNIPLVYEAVSEVFSNELPHYELELIFVDDGSNDASPLTLKSLEEKDLRVRAVYFSRNFGKEAATSAGLSHATGDAVMMIDADMQHPPRLIPRFVSEWEKGIDVVAGVRTKNSSQKQIKSFLSKNFYRFMHRISDVRIESGETDFRLLDRVVVDAFCKLSERQRMTRALINWLGFTRTNIEFEADERVHGEAKYSSIKLARLALHAIVTNSLVPLRMVGYLGLLITVSSFIFGGVVFVQRYIFSDILGWGITGTAQLAIILVFLVGIILIALGMIALYLENVHKESLGRPLYVTKKKNSRISHDSRVVAVSGGFDPVHIGHVRMFEEARKLGDRLIVILNNDAWLRAKKGFAFMPEQERAEIIKSFTSVDDVVITSHAENDPDRSVSKTLEQVRPHVFANGGDRKNEADIPEAVICKKYGIEMVFNVGQGGKVQSSSWLIEKSQKKSI